MQARDASEMRRRKTKQKEQPRRERKGTHKPSPKREREKEKRGNQRQAFRATKNSEDNVPRPRADFASCKLIIRCSSVSPMTRRMQRTGPAGKMTRKTENVRCVFGPFCECQLRIISLTRLAKSVNAIHGLLLHYMPNVEADGKMLVRLRDVHSGKHHCIKVVFLHEPYVPASFHQVSIMNTTLIERHEEM
jgi:hypothetical protein